MDWPPNREGLSWFLERVWPEVRKRRPEARLKVAGSGEAGWLSAHEGFDWLGRITCVEELYRDAHAVIAPVHFGGGTKIKVVEAFSHGRPVFATLGARLGSGLSGENFALLSDDPAAWISAMVGADKGSLAKRGVAAFHEAEGIFGAEQAGRTFISLLTGKGA
jgi:glycosyltransferase involved in cell wall biosynthesis